MAEENSVDIANINSNIKPTFSVHKLIPKNVYMTILYTNWSLY